MQLIDKAKTLLNSIRQSKFTRNVVTVAAGTMVAQLIALIAAPILTRLYDPAAFGIFGIFTTVAGLLVPIAALSYPAAIVLPRNDLGARQVVRLAVLTAVLISGCTGVALVLAQDLMVRLFGTEELRLYLYLIPVFMLFSALMQVARQWRIRQRDFTVLATSNIAQAMVINTIQVAFGLFAPSASALISTQTFSHILHAGILVISRPSIKENAAMDLVAPREQSPVPTIIATAREFRDFPMYRAPEQLANTASQSLPLVLLAAFFGPVVAGLYTICRTVLSLPTRLLGESVGAVFYPRITRSILDGTNPTQLLLKATILLAIVAAVPFAAVVLFGPSLFTFVFGSEWTVAGEFARWVAVWRYFDLLRQPAVQALPALKAQRWHLQFTLVTVGLRAAALSIGYLFYDSAHVSVALFSLVGAICSILLIWIVVRRIDRFGGHYGRYPSS